MNFSEKLKSLRKEKDLTQTELGKIFNLSKQTISSYENGGSSPDKEMLQEIADFFGVSVDYLLGRTDSKAIGQHGKLKELDENSEVDDILEILHKRPEMKMLFSVTKNATKEDIEKAARIIEALKDK